MESGRKSFFIFLWKRGSRERKESIPSQNGKDGMLVKAGEKSVVAESESRRRNGDPMQAGGKRFRGDFFAENIETTDRKRRARLDQKLFGVLGVQDDMTLLRMDANPLSRQIDRRDDLFISFRGN